MSHQKCQCISTQKQLGETQMEIELRIQKKLKEVDELKQAVESLKVSIDKRVCQH